jgi:glutathione S-transferase
LNAPDPILYSFRRCPYAIRARLTLRYAGIQCVLREVILRSKPPELIECSAKGTVPVLVLGDGEVIDESLDIMLWALAQSDPDGWLDVDMPAAIQLIKRNDSEFKFAIDHYKYPDRYSDSGPNIGSDQCRADGENFLADLDDDLQRTAYLCGDRLSIVDVAVLPFVRQFAYVDIVWFQQTRLSAVKRWLGLFLDSALFASVMVKYPAWQSGGGDRPQIF